MTRITHWLLLMIPVLLAAQAKPEPVQSWVLSQPWRFHLGDDSRWKGPAFDDSAWTTLLPSKRWTDQGITTDASGFAWYRLAVTIETAEPLYLWFPELKTAGEVFVNGVKVMQHGSPGDIYRSNVAVVPLAPLPLLPPGGRALIAVRVWLSRDESVSHLGGGIAVPPQLGPRLPMQQAFQLQLRERQRDNLGFALTGLLGVFLAFLLIVCWRRQPNHSEYGWYAGMLAGRALFDLVWYGLWGLGVYRSVGLLTSVAYATNLGCSYYFFRTYFGKPGPRSFRWVLSVCLLFVAANGGGWVDWLTSIPSNQLLFAGQLPIMLANAALLFSEVRLGNRQAWLLGLPYLVYASGLLTRIAWFLLTFSGGMGKPEDFLTGGLLVLQEPIAVPIELAGLVLGSLAMTGILLNRFTRVAVVGERLTGELEAARQVQELLLPASSVALDGYAIESRYLPANEVGGDFYQIRPLADGCVLVVVGDVSGKGLKAAMLVSVAIGILRNEKSTSPGAILGALNDGLTGHTGGGFVTCCCARFDADGQVTLANAGHPSPYTDGREVAVEAGLPLGVMAGVEYEESVVRGERFTFVSDGVVEAENAQRELFGFDRTHEISTKSAQEIAEAAKAWGQNDDITVVTVRRNS